MLRPRLPSSAFVLLAFEEAKEPCNGDEIGVLGDSGVLGEKGVNGVAGVARERGEKDRKLSAEALPGD